MFDLPSLITTSASDGPNGPLLHSITEILPNAPVIHRPGQINAWDCEQFVEAVKTLGRKKLILAGVSTDVCLAFAAISAINDGYEVYAVVDASGTWNQFVAQIAILRMIQAKATRFSASLQIATLLCAADASVGPPKSLGDITND